jgi:hypothetical protein
MWGIFWEWALKNHVYNAVVILAVFFIIVNFLARILKTEWVQNFLNKYKNIEFGKGGLKLEREEESNSEKDKQQDNALIFLKDELNKINNRLDRQYEYIKEAAIKSCTAIIWGEKVPIIEFLDAAFLSLNLGVNGNTNNRIIEVVIGADAVAVYRSELSKFRKENKNISGHFNESITAINKNIY